MSIKIDPEFSELIPSLSADEYEQLENNIVSEGIRDALVTWDQGDGNEILIDGHNRWNISVKHGGIPFKTERKHFPDRDAAKLWIIKNQLGRRNLPAFERASLALKMKPLIAEKAKEQQGTRTDISQKSVKSRDTQKELAAIAGVSHDTIHKVETIQNSGDPELIRQVKDGKTTINRAYQVVKGIDPGKPKTPAQMHKERVDKAQEEHEQFKQQKVVDFSDISKDKDNRRVIAKSLYSDLLNIGKKIEDVSIRSKEKAIDIPAMSAMLTHEERELLLNMIGVWRSQLAQIAMEVVQD